MSFRIVCLILSMICAALFMFLAVDPGRYIAIFGVPMDEGGRFMGRRVAPLALGFALLLWMSRGLPVGEARNTICLVVAVTFVFVALTGLTEFARGAAGVTIVGAAICELAMAAAIWAVRRREDA